MIANCSSLWIGLAGGTFTLVALALGMFSNAINSRIRHGKLPPKPPPNYDDPKSGLPLRRVT